MGFYYVYVLKSIRTGKLYKGYTENLKNRLEEHNLGKVKATSPYKPYRLIYYESFLNKTDALRQEKYLKSGSGKELIKDKLRNYLTSK